MGSNTEMKLKMTKKIKIKKKSKVINIKGAIEKIQYCYRNIEKIPI